MKTKTEHLDLNELWACLSGEGVEENVLRHWQACPFCRQEARRWQAVFQQQAQRTDEKLEKLPGFFWQKLETGILSRIRDTAPTNWLLFMRPAVAAFGMLFLACLVGWYGNQWTPISAEQIDLAANFVVDYSVDDSMEEQLWIDVDRLIRQAPGGELSDLFFEED
jgi:hypothetical protein